MTMQTNVPGRAPISFAHYYKEFESYYLNCEMATKRWWVEHVQPDWHIIDAGANVGYYSILFSQLAPEGHIYAFEPTDTVGMLVANLNENNAANVEAFKVALGARSGRRADAIFRLWGAEPERNEVDFVSIDDFVSMKGMTRVDAIKIDVDSFDLEVLLGAEQTLRRFDPYVVVELNHALNKRQQSNAQAFHWLASIGYREAEVLEYENYVLKRSDNLAAKHPGALRFDLVFS